MVSFKFVSADTHRSPLVWWGILFMSQHIKCAPGVKNVMLNKTNMLLCMMWVYSPQQYMWLYPISLPGVCGGVHLLGAIIYYNAAVCNISSSNRWNFLIFYGKIMGVPLIRFLTPCTSCLNFFPNYCFLDIRFTFLNKFSVFRVLPYIRVYNITDHLGWRDDEVIFHCFLCFASPSSSYTLCN